VRKRLIIEYSKIGSYAKLARKYGVNVRYLHDFIKHGKVPASKQVWKKMRVEPWVSEAADNLVELRKHYANK